MNRRWFPELETREQYFSLLPDESLWLPGIDEIRRREDLPGPLTRGQTGSNIVYRAGESAWIKLNAPLFADELVIEGRLLPAVEGRLPVDVPRVLARGELEGWTYLILSHVEGSSIGDLWHTLVPDAQRKLAHDIGEMLHVLHGVDAAGLDDLPAHARSRLEPPRADLLAHHRKTGLGEPWLAAIPGFLERALARSPARGIASVLLHADVTPDHVLISGDEDPRIVGMIDFADAFVGPREYDFAAPAVHLFRGRADLLGALLDGYGWDTDLRGEAGSRRFLAWWLLHRFANLPRLVGPDLAATPAGDLDTLATRLFPLATGRGCTRETVSVYA